jgi:hypothetical protein
MLIDPNEDRRGELAFALYISGFAITESEADADAVVSYDPNDAWRFRTIIASASETRAELFERVRVRAIRKPGPVGTGIPRHLRVKKPSA